MLLQKKKKTEKQFLEAQKQMKTDQIYFYQFPFRAVFPYQHKYETFAKSRWYEKPLLPTLIKQFKAYDQEYYQLAVQEGRITINGNKVPIDYKIKNGDKLIHQALREEPPILDIDIQIIEENQEYLIVNKPPSFTVHTGGGFHYNTLLSILQTQKGYKDLFVLHRLDRLTSGLIIFGRTKDKPQIFHKQNQNEQMKKMYFARVSGNFAWEEKTLFAQIECVSHKDGVYKVTKQLFDIEKQEQKVAQIEKNNQDQKQKQVVKEDQKNIVRKNKNKNNIKKATNPDFKESKTIFKKVYYDERSNSSLIECYPISGRTHQIRVHLRFLGFPILNDVVYGGRFIGNNFIKLIQTKNNKKQTIYSSCTPKEILNQQQKQHYQQRSYDEFQKIKGQKKIKPNQVNQNEFQVGQRQKQIKRENEADNLVRQKQIQKMKYKLRNEWDYKTKPWEICLHSYQYKLQGKTYKTDKPYWADKNFEFLE